MIYNWKTWFAIPWCSTTIDDDDVESTTELPMMSPSSSDALFESFVSDSFPQLPLNAIQDSSAYERPRQERVVARTTTSVGRFDFGNRS